MLAASLPAAVSGGYVDENVVWHPYVFDWEPIERGDDVVLRLAIGGDSHIGNYYYKGKLSTAYSALEVIGGVDALIIAGDVTDGGLPEQYDALMEIVNANSREATVDIDGVDITATGSAVGTTILSMGNHDGRTTLDGKGSQALFESRTGQAFNKLYRLAGIPIIKMSPGENIWDEGTYHEYEDFILGAFDEIDRSGYTGPIIGIAHHPIPTPFEGKSEFYSDAELAAFAAHPNFIMFTGHSHTMLYDTARVINQSAGFTQVRTGTLGNGYGATNGGSARNPDTGRINTPYTDSPLHSCQCLLVDVLADGRVVVKRLDINKGTIIFGDEDFVIDPATQIDPSGEKANWYATGRAKGTFGAGSRAPSFPDGASVSIADEGNHDTIIVTFPKATPASDSARDYLWRYRVRITDPDGESVFYNFMNDIHLMPQRDVWQVAVIGLLPGVDYKVAVCAQTAYGATSDFIEYDGVANVGVLETTYPPVTVVDFNGKAEETHGREALEIPGRSKIVENSATGGDAVQFMGFGGYGFAFGPDDFARIKYSYTLECYFKTPDVTSAQCLLGSINSANTALRIDGGELFLWGMFRSMANKTSADRIVAKAPIKAREWVHAVAVYNGTEVRLFINGELAATGKVSGGLDEPTYVEDPGDGAFWIGSMASKNESSPDIRLNVVTKTEIGIARVYEGAMTDDDVKEAYRGAAAKKASAVFRDVEKGAFYEDPVSWAVARGVTAGTGPDTFSPEDGCTRGQVVTFLWRAAGSPEPSGKTNPFRDVGESDYYFKPVLWAVENGITAGTGKTTFSPSDTCTRGQIVTFLWRSSGNPAPSSSSNPFSDVKSGDYFADAVLWAVGRSITLGTGKTTFSPSDTCTRGQVVTFLYRNSSK